MQNENVKCKKKKKVKNFTFCIVILIFAFCTLHFKLISLFFEKRPNYNNSEKLIISLDDNGSKFTLITSAKTVGEILGEQNIRLEKGDQIFPEEKVKVAGSMTVAIRRALPIAIKVDGREEQRMTFAKNVEEAILSSGVSLSRLDKVFPEKSAGLEKDMVITITRINVEEVVEEEEIEYSTVEKNDPNLKWKKQRVEQEGEDGLREVKYKITYTNGKQSSKVKLASSVVKQPTSKIVYNGTKIEVGRITKGRASWYAYTGTMACASLQFPKGTWLRVTNMDNKKQVIVQVNDSGPYAKDKIIDLDKVAFQKIGSLSQGVVNVKVEEILD